jgi:poly(3-hydroxybutyrate) depolymerase
MTEPFLYSGRFFVVGWLLISLSLATNDAAAQSATSSDFTSHVQSDLGSGVDLPYRLFVPEGYDPANQYPLMLWLHGWGERGTNNSSQLGGPFTAAIENFLSAENQVRHPCIVIAPQLPYNEWWHHRLEVEAILADIETNYSIDTTRRYITGMSWGGMGTWAYLTNWPDYWAAAVPICGHSNSGGASSRLDDVPDMPIWAFHAANDTIVGVEGTDNAVMDHRRDGGNALYTRYDSAGHNAWTPAYETPQLVEWVMSQRRDDSGSGVVHVDPLPYITIDTAVVGSSLQLEGRIREEGRGDGPEQDLQIDSVYWWSEEIGYEERGWDAVISGRSITSTSASFTQADVGKRILLGNNNLDKWNGYVITSVTNANTVGVEEWLGSFPSVYWELQSPGSRYAPVAVDGLDNWSADDIPLSPGTNRIHIVARADSQSAYGGYAWLVGDTIEVELPNPVTTPEWLQLSLNAPAEPGILIVSTANSISLSGTVTGVTGSATLTWENNRGGSGSEPISGTWNIPSIPVKEGYNRIRVAVVDSAGAEVSHIFWVVGNQLPQAPPRQYLHAYPDSLQTIHIAGDFTDPDAWPSVRPFLGGVNAAGNGTISYANGVVEYSPNPGFSGMDRFTYELSDGFQHSEGVVTITVGGVLSDETSLLDLSFDTATVPGDVVGTPPSGASYVDDISAETDGGTWSIHSGGLRLVRPGTGGGDSGAGFRKNLPAAEAVVVKFDLKVTASYSGFWNDLIVLNLGDFATIGEYDAWINGSRIADNLRIVGRGTSNMSLAQGSVNPVWEGPTDGSTLAITWFVNTADSPRTWQGPNGVLYTVDPHASTLLLNGSVIQENLPRASGLTNEGLSDLFVTINGNAASTIEFDNFSITEVGEAPPSDLISWRLSNGLATDGSEDESEATNGKPVVVNYAFGLNDQGSTQLHSELNVLSLPQIDFSSGAEFSFLARDPDTNPGLIYEVKWSTDLSNWEYLNVLPTTESVGDGWVRMKWPMDESLDAAFYKVKLVPLD